MQTHNFWLHNRHLNPQAKENYDTNWNVDSDKKKVELLSLNFSLQI